MIKLILLGEPKSTNNIYKYHCKFGFPSGYMSAEGKKLKESYQKQLAKQWSTMPLKGSIRLKVELFFKRGGRHDYDNFGKILNDSFTGIVWDDDSQVEDARIIKNIDKENPRIEVEIEEL